jgi:hypothetical protein
MIRAVVVAGGEFQGLVEFQNQDEYAGYLAGLHKGAGIYDTSGRDDVGLYTADDYLFYSREGDIRSFKIARVIREYLMGGEDPKP